MRSDEHHQQQLEQQEQEWLAEIHNRQWKINCADCRKPLGDHVGPHPIVMTCWSCQQDREPTENYGGIHG